MKYNRKCEVVGCDYWCREDNAICHRCYKHLPLDMKRLLWDENPATILSNRSIVLDWINSKGK